MTTTYGSVCSGIEAASVAWHSLGWAPAWFAEIDPFPSAVLEHHWPQVPNLGDFTAIRDMIAAGAVEAPDVLVGGTPCQAFSVAGLRNSLDDHRGQLSLEFVRLADAIDDRRTAPCTIVWENVPGVLSTKDNAFGCFLGALAGEDAALVPPGGRWTNAGRVYGPKRTVAWRILDAQYFGVAQRRRRVFVVASAGELRPEQVLFELDGVRRDSAPRREAGKGTTHDVAPCLTSGGRGVERTRETRGQDPVVAVAPTLQANRKAAGSATQQDAENGALVFGFNARQDPDSWEERTGPLDTDGGTQAVAFSCKDYGDGQFNYAMSFEPGVMSRCGGHTYEGVSDTLRKEPGDNQMAVATFGEVARTLTAQHNSSPCADRGMDVIALQDVAQPVRSNPRNNSDPGMEAHMHAMSGMRVRRLTPTECERLQGFPDGHTRIPWKFGYWPEGSCPPEAREALAEACPDGPRYKALGNSMAVPVMRWIGERIARHHIRLHQEIRAALERKDGET